MRLTYVLTAALFVVACEKSSSPTGAVRPQDSASSQAAPPPPSGADAAAATTAIAASTGTTEAVGSAHPTPGTDAAPGTALSTLAAADGGKGGDAGGPASSPSALKPASKHIDGSNFALALASPGCKAGIECAMTIKLVATADYHVNKEYPYKFVATPTASVAFLGKPDATTFTRAAGDFTEEGEKTGTMTIRFKPSTPGAITIAGTYKFSVCSADQCQIEQEKLELPIAVQ